RPKRHLEGKIINRPPAVEIAEIDLKRQPTSKHIHRAAPCSCSTDRLGSFPWLIANQNTKMPMKAKIFWKCPLANINNL
ncbi:MAG: hypothetical protein K0M47_04490, partial [Rhizobium sp.]|nr:hypothetical protein [Rhizobium sp.]